MEAEPIIRSSRFTEASASAYPAGAGRMPPGFGGRGAAEGDSGVGAAGPARCVPMLGEAGIGPGPSAPAPALALA